MKFPSLFYTFILTAGIWAFAAEATETCNQSNVAVKSRVGEVEKGMSREQVIMILGPYIRSLSPEGYAPFCDTFMYNETIDAKFVHVMYLNSVVYSASDGHDTVCSFI